MPLQMFVFVKWPPPTSVVGWFTLFQESAVVGLLDMDLLLVADFVLLGFVMAALSAALIDKNRALAASALVLELAAIAVYMASATAFEMLTLSRGYALAETAQERSMFLGAGQAMLATWQGTAFNVSYVLSAAALLAISAVMLNSGIFSSLTARAGLVAGALSVVPASFGTVGLALSLLSLPPTALWLALVARGLFTLAQPERRPRRTEKPETLLRSAGASPGCDDLNPRP
jgi:hypothetical protein